MKLVSDAKDYSQDLGGSGFALLAFSVLVLFVLPLYLVVQPPESLIAIRPVLVAEAAGSVIVLFTIALFLKSTGMLMNVPLKVYEEGILIQPVLSTMPKAIPFQRISSLEIFRARNGRSGCSVLSRDEGRQRSVETFIDAMRARGFVESIRPALEAAGFASSIEGDARSLRAMFRKKAGRPRIPAA
jgi:hypothetical protein